MDDESPQVDPAAPEEHPPPFWQSEEAFKDAVAQATRAATEAVITVVEKRRPVWMLMVATAIGFLAACVIAIPTTIILDNQWHSSEVHNSETNCVLITEVAGALEKNFEEGIKSKDEFLKNSRDRLGLSQSQFQRLIESSEKSQRHQLDAVQGVARTDCAIVK
jgi:hypothetical protein